MAVLVVQVDLMGVVVAHCFMDMAVFMLLSANLTLMSVLVMIIMAVAMRVLDPDMLMRV